MFPTDDEFAQFVKAHRPRMARFAAQLGVAASDVDDIVQAAFVAAYELWPLIRQPSAFLRRVIRNQAARLWRRQLRDRCVAQRLTTDPGIQAPHADHLANVRACLLALSPRQNQILAAAIDGYSPAETADALGISPGACRRHLFNARERLRALLDGAGGAELLDSVLGKRLFAAWENDERLPASPRRVIQDGWRQCEQLKIDRKRGAAVKPLDREEVEHRRRDLPLSTNLRLLGTLTDLGRAEGVMSVITDAHALVLWRGGCTKVLDLAGSKGFVVGGSWRLEHQGSNGISLALLTGAPTKIDKWEHYVKEHHVFCCYATPVHDHATGRLLGTLNVTGTRPIRRGLMRHIDSLAGSLHQP